MFGKTLRTKLHLLTFAKAHHTDHTCPASGDLARPLRNYPKIHITVQIQRGRQWLTGPPALVNPAEIARKSTKKGLWNLPIARRSAFSVCFKGRLWGTCVTLLSQLIQATRWPLQTEEDSRQSGVGV